MWKMQEREGEEAEKGSRARHRLGREIEGRRSERCQRQSRQEGIRRRLSIQEGSVRCPEQRCTDDLFASKQDGKNSLSSTQSGWIPTIALK